MKIALIGCTNTKEEKRCQAIDMYMPSLYYKYRRRYAEEVLQADKIYILSAKHFLLSGNDEIEPYNVCLDDFSRKCRKDWADRVFKSIKENSDFEDAEIYILAGKNIGLTWKLYFKRMGIILKMS